MVWWIFKKRRQRKTATQPNKPRSPSPNHDLKPLEQEQEDSDVEGSSSLAATTRHLRPSSRTQCNNNSQGDNDKNTTVHYHSNPISLIPAAISTITTITTVVHTSSSTSTSANVGRSGHTSMDDNHQTQSQARKPSTAPIPLLTGASESQPKDIHIDHVNMDMETLLPVVVSDEIQPVTPLQLQQFQQNRSAISPVSAEAKQSIPFPVVVSSASTTTPTPRRPALTTRKSDDGHSTSNKTQASLCHPPPPPPPTIPPPAIPLTFPGGLPESPRQRVRASSESASRSSIYPSTVAGHLVYTRGRCPRESTEFESWPSMTAEWTARRSISMDSNSDWPLDKDPPASPRGRFSSSGQRPFGPISPPPSTPPPPLPSADYYQPIHRRRHQRSPSQLLNTSFCASPERKGSSSTISPISPPLSPLTIQVPRPSSRAVFQGSAPGSMTRTAPGCASANRASSESPVPKQSFSSKTMKIPAPQVQNQSQLQHRRARSRSIGLAEIYRLTLSSSMSTSSSPVPGAPISLPPPPIDPEIPPATQSYLLLRRPSLVLHHQQPLAHVSARASEGLKLNSPASFASTPTVAEAGPSSEKDRRRRSRSMDSWRKHSSSSSSLSSSTTLAGYHHQGPLVKDKDRYSNENDERLVASSVCDSDKELQAIIADARAIAAAKSAAIRAARESGWTRQPGPIYQGIDPLYQQQYQHQWQDDFQKHLQRHQGSSSSSMPWTSSAENDGDDGHLRHALTAQGSSASSSRTESPFYSTS